MIEKKRNNMRSDAAAAAVAAVAAVTVERVHFRSAKQLLTQPSEEDCAKPSAVSPT